MTERSASRTAMGTAYLRAAHQLLDAPPRILEDAVVLRLLGPGAEKRIRDEAARYGTREMRALRSHVVLRSRFAEDRLAAAVRRGVAQYIILGAGLDTFALRQPQWAQDLRIIEVDHPGTQEMKLAMLAAAGIEVAANVLFGGIDLENESLESGLTRYDVVLVKPAFFSWLGVTMYLREDSIDAILRSVATFPLGSEIVLTFAPRSDSTVLSSLEQHVAELGEPWLSHFEPEAMEAMLLGAGFRSVEFLSPAEAEARYFCNLPAGLPVPRRTSIVSAIR